TGASGSFTSATRTVAPRSCTSCAVASPMPLAPPTTTACFPSNRNLSIPMLCSVLTPVRSGGEEGGMARVRVHNFAVSLDGYAAGPDQDVHNPLGVGGTRLHERVFETR